MTLVIDTTMRISKQARKRFVVSEPVIPGDKAARTVISKNTQISGSLSDSNPPRHHKQPLTPVLYGDWHVANIWAPPTPKAESRKYVYDSTNYAKYYFFGRDCTD